MKIAYIVGTLATQGGTARMVTEKANMLTAHLGYDVTIITLIQRKDEINTFTLSDSVKRIHLEIPLFLPYKYKYPKRLWIRFSVNRLMRKKLTEAVNELNPDILLGIGQYQADLVCTIKCHAKKIIECHEARCFTHAGFGMDLSLLSRVYLSIHRRKYFQTIERHADAIATLTEKDKLLWGKAKHVEVIPNFSTMKVTKYSDCTSKRVIAVGRLEWEKGYGRLLEVWKIVSLRYPDWKLDIFGEGSFQNALETIIRNNAIKNIEIHNFTHSISQEFANSSICTLTSCYEGFSLVLLEAMKHGVPCIAFDCPFGPSSIIQDSLNGFLVHDGDIRLFAERLCLMIEDTKMRKEFSKEAIIRANYFNKEAVLDTWETLFESIL
jgi:glycosyltransferase involved in cell wall biosynthesis